MSRTYRKEHTSNLFHNGEHGPHNTLLKEFKGLRGGTVKSARNLIDRRDYKSDRLNEWRRVMNKIRRNHLKNEAKNIINENN